MRIYTRHKTRHGLHLFLTIITAGLWSPVWLMVAAWNRMGPRDKTVVRDGPPHYVCGYHTDPYCRHTNPPQLKGSVPWHQR